MSVEEIESALTLALDARDAAHKARRRIEKLRAFCPQIYAAISSAEDSNIHAINVLLGLRRKQADEATQKAAA